MSPKEQLIDMYYLQVQTMLTRIEYLEGKLKLYKTKIKHYEKK